MNAPRTQSRKSVKETSYLVRIANVRNELESVVAWSEKTSSGYCSERVARALELLNDELARSVLAA